MHEAPGNMREKGETSSKILELVPLHVRGGGGGTAESRGEKKLRFDLKKLLVFERKCFPFVLSGSETLGEMRSEEEFFRFLKIERLHERQLFFLLQ